MAFDHGDAGGICSNWEAKAHDLLGCAVHRNDFSMPFPYKAYTSNGHQWPRFRVSSGQAPQGSKLDIVHRPASLECKARPGGWGNPARCQSCGGLPGGAVEKPVIKTIPVPRFVEAMHLPSSSFGDGVHGLFSSASGWEFLGLGHWSCHRAGVEAGTGLCQCWLWPDSDGSSCISTGLGGLLQDSGSICRSNSANAHESCGSLWGSGSSAQPNQGGRLRCVHSLRVFGSIFLHRQLFEAEGG